MINVHIQRPRDSELYFGLFDYVDHLKNVFDMKNKSMIEIGCYQGESTEVFSKVFGKIYAVDPWINGYDKNDISSHVDDMVLVESAFDKRMQSYNGLVKYKMSSKDFFDNFNDSVDFTYIDGNHQYEAVVQDIKSASKFSKYIGGHDYGTFQIIEALKGFLKLNELNNEIVSVFPDSSWIINKRFI